MGTGRSGLGRGKGDSGTTYKELKSGADIKRALDPSEWEQQLDMLDRASIYNYSTEGKALSYDKTNTVLRDSKYAGLGRDELLTALKQDGVSSSIINQIKHLDSGLQNFEVKESFIGFRGAGYSLLTGEHGSISFEELKKYEGKIVHDRGNLSMSTRRGSEFTRPVFYEIEVPQGTNLGANIRNISAFKSEDEYLTQRGLLYEVRKVSKSGSGKPIVRLRIVGKK